MEYLLSTQLNNHWPTFFSVRIKTETTIIPYGNPMQMLVLVLNPLPVCGRQKVEEISQYYHQYAQSKST